MNYDEYLCVRSQAWPFLKLLFQDGKPNAISDFEQARVLPTRKGLSSAELAACKVMLLAASLHLWTNPVLTLDGGEPIAPLTDVETANLRRDLVGNINWMNGGAMPVDTATPQAAEVTPPAPAVGGPAGLPESPMQGRAVLLALF